MSNNSNSPFSKNNNSRNKAGIFEHYTAPAASVKQSDFL
jgi:hypothetical protein